VGKREDRKIEVTRSANQTDDRTICIHNFYFLDFLHNLK